MKIISVVGARPNFMKAAPFINTITNNNKSNDNKISHLLVHTGQNYDYELNELFFEELEIKRFPHIKINFGEHIGFILFQIDNDDSFSNIKLIYRNKILKINNYSNHFNY